MNQQTVPVQLSEAEVALLIEALDSHEYCQLSEANERNDGYSTIEDGESEEVDAAPGSPLKAGELRAGGSPRPPPEIASSRRQRPHAVASPDSASFWHEVVPRIERERIDKVVEQHLDPLNQAVREFLAKLDA